MQTPLENTYSTFQPLEIPSQGKQRRVKLRIAIVHDMFYPYTVGGAEKRYWELAKRLAKEHDVHIYTMQWHNMSKEMRINGVSVHSVCKPISTLYTSRDKRTLLNPVLFAFRLIPYLAKERFDIIDSNSSPFFHFFAVRFINLSRHVPIITTSHEVWGDFWYDYFGNKLLGFVGKTIERVALIASSRVVVLSRRHQMRCVNIGIPLNKTKIIQNGADIESIKRIKKSRNASDVIYVGRLISYKHVDVLIAAIAEVKLAIPKVKCLIIGDGPERINLEKQVKQLNLEKNIQLLGFLENQREVISHLKASKIFVLPSTREGFPLVVPEACACRLPIITVRHELNGATTLVEDGKNGFIVELSGKSVGGRIAELLSNRSTLARMSKCASAFAENYDWEKVVTLVEDMYCGLARAR